jgi:hypothetical protein
MLPTVRWIYAALLCATAFAFWVLDSALPRWAAVAVALALGVTGYLALIRVPGKRARSAPAPTAAATSPTPTAEDHRVLDALGIATDDGELRAACARVARRIRAEKLRVIGFVPADDKVAVPPVLIQLGLSLCDLTGATVAVIDANVRYPGLGQLNIGKQTDSDESVFSTRWLRGSLALLSPPRVERAGEVVPQLARVLLDGSDLFAHVLVDLTGFELLGEHGSAAACMDAVALVGRAHHTHEDELLALAPLMPKDRFLGILLVG